MDESAGSVGITLQHGVRAASQAREFVRGWLIDTAPAEGLEDAVLITSELVTNALGHGGTHIMLRLGERPRGCRIEVYDSGLTARTPAGQGAGCVERGIGLTVVSALAELGQDLDGGGTVVWAELSW